MKKQYLKYYSLSYFPGILLAFAIVLLSKLIVRLPFPPFKIDDSYPVDNLIIVIIAGILLGNLKYCKRSLEKGINFSADFLLKVAIVILGARLNYTYLSNISYRYILIIVSSIIFVFITIKIINYFCKAEKDLALLIAAGTAICGGAAIAVLAKTINAKKENTSISIILITLLGSIAIFLYPFIGRKLGMTSEEFGLLAGVSVHSVPQTISTAIVFSKDAGDIAIIIKLIRVLMLLPIIILIKYSYNKKKIHNNKTSIFDYIPIFIIGFITMSIISSLSLIDSGLLATLSKISSSLLYMAMFAIGYKTNIKAFSKISPSLLFLGIFSSLGLFIFSYTISII